MKNKLTYIEFFRKNGMWPMVFILVIFITSLFLSIIRDDLWHLSFIFLGIACIFPIAQYFDWKKKYPK